MPLLAGRPTVVVPLLVSLTLLFLIFPLLHPPSRPLPAPPLVPFQFLPRRHSVLRLSHHPPHYPRPSQDPGRPRTLRLLGRRHRHLLSQQHQRRLF
ncbi:hypothetical protein P691DRAFT_120017 [Macrolepiota fuliginosa MF-IS2]|uniref:Uncharacterized protein n=1 Tax=Macrolepiota fuliginosa MF-IS2 TaxID=1400762 RepID=A0A9P5XNR7_9AGAR|nr:hypothetical protein P691DRAFT_120017 [Macrolepiota fuliginosa MF-IS2]